MSINPIGGAGGGMNPDVNRPKTPEERQAEADERRRKWEVIHRQVDETASKIDDATRGGKPELWTDDDGRERLDARR
jgi:hypothetical protein